MMVDTARMKSWTDSLYGFTVSYPGFFNPTDDCRFTFYPPAFNPRWRDCGQIEMQCRVMRSKADWNAEEALRTIGETTTITRCNRLSDGIIIDGTVGQENGAVSGHRYHAKCIMRQKLLFVFSLVYTEDCSEAVGRLRKVVDQWEFADEPQISQKNTEELKK